ncbi:Peptidase S26A, signal peptidase I [Anaerobutyricum hallii]|uniref:Signal peptidase I n=1 Tax=Anaerobutyricum hallii TaxID=39488 RepID=A0A285PZV6_9FIRM|nr:signal peptidase I [Anaerobutyricum hallii]SOB73485.1 Peptidase S26A, signal peptidase I [Anaerobutyricum hallii]
MRAANNRSCSQIIRKRRREAETRNGYIQLFIRIVLVIVCGGLLFTQGFLITRAPDNGMFSAVKGGDLLIGFRLQRTFLKNDVVVYKVNGKEQVGRILGQETDVITLDDSGELLVNGTPQTGEIAFPTYAKKGIKKYPYRVPKGCVFILGDYRTQAKDSRDYGPIKKENVKAKVITVLRRREL